MRLPQPIIRLMLRELGHSATPAEADALALEALAASRAQGSRAANKLLLERLGLDLSYDRDESYYHEALHYHLGLLFGHMRQPERMADHIRLSHSMPSPEDDQIFSDRVTSSFAARDWQERARERGMPPILVACMPRSASGTLTQTLSRLFDMPAIHLSIGWFPDYYLAPSWLDMFLEGGAITQDHFGPGDFNAGVLAGRKIRDMFVLARDPRAAACSWARFTARADRVPGPPGQSFDQRVEQICTDHFIPWLRGWCERARDAAFPTRIHWMTHREVASDLPALVRRIVEVMGDQYPALQGYADRAEVTEVRSHFVQGSDQAWRQEIGETTKARLWEACTPDIRDVLNLLP